jgi:hypothetical protein
MPATARLVTLTQAKAHLQITLPEGDPGDAEIQSKLDEAEETILNYLKGARGQAIDWVDPLTAPGPVTAAIKLMLGRLYEQRGDDEENDERVWTAIDRLLARYHSPAIA